MKFVEMALHRRCTSVRFWRNIRNPRPTIVGGCHAHTRGR